MPAPTQGAPPPRRPAGVYSKTVNLPQTKFDMRANSVVREPQLQQFWQDNRIYEQLSRENPGVSTCCWCWPMAAYACLGL